MQFIEDIMIRNRDLNFATIFQFIVSVVFTCLYQYQVNKYIHTTLPIFNKISYLLQVSQSFWHDLFTLLNKALNS